MLKRLHRPKLPKSKIGVILGNIKMKRNIVHGFLLGNPSKWHWGYVKLKELYLPRWDAYFPAFP